MIKIEDCRNKQVISVHTDFNIKLNPSLKIIIEQINGVEDLDTFGCHKYNFIVQFGKAFYRDIIKKEVEKKMNEFSEL